MQNARILLFFVLIIKVVTSFFFFYRISNENVLFASLV